MNELSLFTGGGGGIYGSRLLGWQTVGYVEINAYCQKIIAQRIEDKIFDRAPIFGDIRKFICEGHADSYKGMVDVITAGFPCQPFSVAGNRGGANDPRNLWPQTIDVIRRVRPRYALLENVPGLLAHEYFGEVLGSLAEAGYDTRWCVLGAGDIGALHNRKRVWIIAYADSLRSQGQWFSSAKSRPWEQLERLVQADLRVSVPAGKSGGVADGVADRRHRLGALGNGQFPAVVRAAWHLLGGSDV